MTECLSWRGGSPLGLAGQGEPEDTHHLVPYTFNTWLDRSMVWISCLPSVKETSAQFVLSSWRPQWYVWSSLFQYSRSVLQVIQALQFNLLSHYDEREPPFFITELWADSLEIIKVKVLKPSHLWSCGELEKVFQGFSLLKRFRDCTEKIQKLKFHRLGTISTNSSSFCCSREV